MGKRIFFHAFCLAAFAAGAPLAAQAQTPAAPPAVISVTGEAHISVPPDLVQIDAGVTSEAKTAREASDANNAAMSKVLLALKGAGIDEKDYQTSRLSLQAQSSVARPGAPPIITGYRASNRVTIRL
ncbi:MAG: SIMPL domain-containing protein, partial [Bradyrhizobium sp.]